MINVRKNRGGNTGVADADNLAWKLAAVLRGRAPAALLASYNQERLEAAQENVQETNRTARLLRPADGLDPVSYTHLQAHETVLVLECRLLLEKKNSTKLIFHHLCCFF